MFWFYVTIGILVVSSVWGVVDLAIVVRKSRNKEYEERNGKV